MHPLNLLALKKTRLFRLGAVLVVGGRSSSQRERVTLGELLHGSLGEGGDALQLQEFQSFLFGPRGDFHLACQVHPSSIEAQPLRRSFARSQDEQSIARQFVSQTIEQPGVVLTQPFVAVDQEYGPNRLFAAVLVERE